MEHLVEAIAVPGLRDELGVAQDRVLRDHLNERRHLQRRARGPAGTVRHVTLVAGDRAARVQLRRSVRGGPGRARGRLARCGAGVAVRAVGSRGGGDGVRGDPVGRVPSGGRPREDRREVEAEAVDVVLLQHTRANHAPPAAGRSCGRPRTCSGGGSMTTRVSFSAVSMRAYWGTRKARGSHQIRHALQHDACTCAGDPKRPRQPRARPRLPYTAGGRTAWGRT